MEAMFLTEMGKMLQFVVKNMRKLDCFWTATIGSVSFLVLWHFWANLVTSMAADHWKVDHVLYYVLRPHRLFKFILVSFTCILLALFRQNLQLHFLWRRISCLKVQLAWNVVIVCCWYLFVLLSEDCFFHHANEYSCEYVTTIGPLFSNPKVCPQSAFYTATYCYAPSQKFKILKWQVSDWLACWSDFTWTVK